MTPLSETELIQLRLRARTIRCLVLDMLAEARSGHTAGALGMADIVAALYFHVMHHDPAHPDLLDRDRLILSNGHIAPVRYAAMALAGYFPLEELHTLRSFGTRLQGHPERVRLPGIETTSGPLGDGLPQAIGVALGGRLDEASWRTFCITSDAEHQCGITWEAIMFAGARKLGRLINIVDRNGIQIGGQTEAVMPIEPLAQKYEAFGWNVVEVDGNSIDMVIDGLQISADADRPTVLIAHTVPGKGVPEIESDYQWHGKVPDRAQADAWIQALTQHDENAV